MAVYFVLGHGFEDIMHERATVPAGCMLVVTEECGMLGTVPHHIYDVITAPENQAVLADPAGKKAEVEALLQKGIRIYREGAKYPWISYTLISDSSVGVEPSGIYRMPVAAVDIEYFPGKQGRSKYTLPEEEADKAFAGSLRPTAAEVTDMSVEDIKALPSTTATQEELFAAAPGVYYNLLCRATIGYSSFIRDRLKVFERGLAAQMLDADKVVDPWGAVDDWIKTLDRAVLTQEQKTALAEIEAELAKVKGVRQRSGSPLENVQFRDIYRIYQQPNPDLAALEAAVEALPVASINERGSHDGQTALMIAVRMGSESAIASLLARGADVNIVNFYQDTALLRACSAEGPKSVSIVQRLLAAGAKTTVVDEDGDNPLMVAAQVPELNPVLLALAAGVDINLGDSEGDTALHMAARGENVGAVPILIGLGANINAQNVDLMTPIMIACEEKSPAMATALMAVPGIDLTIQGQKGRSTLWYAMTSKMDDTAVALINAGNPVKDWGKLREFAVKLKLPKLEELAASRLPPAPQLAT